MEARAVPPAAGQVKIRHPRRRNLRWRRGCRQQGWRAKPSWESGYPRMAIRRRADCSERPLLRRTIKTRRTSRILQAHGLGRAATTGQAERPAAAPATCIAGPAAAIQTRHQAATGSQTTANNRATALSAIDHPCRFPCCRILRPVVETHDRIRFTHNTLPRSTGVPEQRT